MNKQPFAKPPRWWAPKLSPKLVQASRGYRRWRLRLEQRIRDISISGQEHFLRSLQAGHGVLLTPNHAAHFDSAALYLGADQIDTPLHFMTAWQVFEMSSRFDRFLMQRLGCFSIDRESADRQAFKQAVTILKDSAHPLVIFPEGDIYHTSDRVMPFREGAAAVAVAAAKKTNRPISIVPCGIRFSYEDDPTEALSDLMTRLDHRLLLRPEPERSLKDRIYRFATALLSLKEVEYLGSSQSGTLTARIWELANSILQRLEKRHQITPTTKQIPERVQSLRHSIIRKSQFSYPSKPATEVMDANSLAGDLDDLFLVMQLYSYPGDYLRDNPSIERLAETLDKFEEDVLERSVPAVRGRRRVDIRFGEPILVSKQTEKKQQIPELTDRLRGEVQSIIDALAAERAEWSPKTTLTRGGRLHRRLNNLLSRAR